MEQRYIFKLNMLDQSVFPQIRCALEKQLELKGRKQYPGLWRLTDFFNRLPKGDEAAVRRKTAWRWVLSFLILMASSFVILPSLMQPQKMLLPLLAGCVAYLWGVLGLHFRMTKLLTYYEFFQGALTVFVAFQIKEDFWPLLGFGLVQLAVGVLNLLSSLKHRVDRFDKAIAQLAANRNQALKGRLVKVVFSDEGMSASDEAFIPYDHIDMMFESADLFIPIFQGQILLLQKKELTNAPLKDFRKALSGIVQLIALS